MSASYSRSVLNSLLCCWIFWWATRSALAYDDNKRCTKTEKAYQPYTEIVHDYVSLTRKNWFGKVTRFSSPVSYPVTKYKAVDRVVAICCSGFELYYGVCKPICLNGCENGYCAAPHECACSEGYVKENGKCQPDCKGECSKDEHCAAPNVCECNKGYRRRADDKCVPHCEIGCPANERCTAPNVCDCQEGYERIDERCVPVCPEGCPQFSDCTKPHQCLCHSGYIGIQNGSAQLTCKPQCQLLPCPQNSICTKPNQCECLNGYTMRKENTTDNYCEPQCDMDCTPYGRCTAPNVCSCYEGYDLQPDSSGRTICRPICKDPCDNGFCFAPDTCVCNAGYLMGPDNKCMPQCSFDCVNGECVEAEICACQPGYQFQNNSIHVCEPICQPECVFGVCVAPNTCFCANGFRPLSLDDPAGRHICVSLETTTELHETSTETQTTTDSSSQSWSDETSTTPDGYTESTESTEFPMATEICHDQCKCWQPLNSDLGNCERICLDDSDQPCLNVTMCFCLEGPTQELRLHCGQLDDEGEHYSCKVRHHEIKPTSKDLQIDTHKAGKAAQTSKMPWLIIVASVLSSAIILGAALYVGWLKFLKPQSAMRPHSRKSDPQSTELNSCDVIYSSCD